MVTRNNIMRRRAQVQEQRQEQGQQQGQEQRQLPMLQPTHQLVDNVPRNKMRRPTRQLGGEEDVPRQQSTEFIPPNVMSAFRAATQAEPQAATPQAATPPAAEPQAATPQAATPQATAPQASPQQDASGVPSATSARYDPNNPYVAEATRLAKEYGLPENIFLSLIQQESGFKPNAVSPAGAIGLAQLMPGTAEGMGVDPRDWKQNLEGGARYLAQQYKAFGEWPLALAAYNAGPGAVRKAGNAIPNFPETRNYVPTVLRNAGVAGYADGGLIDLARKYADGGSVASSAHVYDPAVIAAIAASIVDPQGYANGGTATGVSSNDATPPDYSGQYNTALSEKLETEFQSLIKQIGRQRDLADYDMRGAFAAGQLKPDGRGHLTSQFKKPNHPTFSQDSIWNGFDGYTGGHWRKDAKQSWSFTPSATNLNMHGIGGLRDYWNKQEAPAGNVLNMGRIPFAAGGYVQGYAEGGRAASKRKKQNPPLFLDFPGSTYSDNQYPINTPDPKTWSPAPVPARVDKGLANLFSTETEKGRFEEGYSNRGRGDVPTRLLRAEELRSLQGDAAPGVNNSNRGRGDVPTGLLRADELQPVQGDAAPGPNFRVSARDLGPHTYVDVGGGITLPLGDVMLMLDASYGKAIGSPFEPNISVKGGVRIPFAKGGGVLSIGPEEDTALSLETEEDTALSLETEAKNILMPQRFQKRPPRDTTLDSMADMYDVQPKWNEQRWPTEGYPSIVPLRKRPDGTTEFVTPTIIRDLINAYTAPYRSMNDPDFNPTEEGTNLAMNLVGAGPASRLVKRVPPGGLLDAPLGLDVPPRLLDVPPRLLDVPPVPAAVPAYDRQLSPLGFYSRAEETAANLAQATGTPQQFRGMLENSGVKPVELRGFDEAFAGRPSVTREELAQHFSERRPQVEETVLGGRGKPEMDDAAKQKWIEDAAAERAYNSGDLDEIRNWGGASDDIRTWHLDAARSDFNEQMAVNPDFASQFQTIGQGGATKFQQYTLPGGENYREVLLKLNTPQAKVVELEGGGGRWGVQMPDGTITSRYYEKFDAEQALRFDAAKQSVTFTSSHWDDPNVLAHLRMSDRTGPNGEKILHLEELQSDWGQKGRTEGFAKPKVDLKPFEADRELARMASLRLSQNIIERESGGRFNSLSEVLNSGDLDLINRMRAAKKTDAEFISANEAFQAADRALQEARAGNRSSIPTAPYVTNTAAWTDLALKRVLREAAEGGYDSIVWTPGAEQAKRWGLVDKPREGIISYYDKMVPNQLGKLVKGLNRNARVGPTDVMLPQGTGPGMGHNNPPFEAPGVTITPEMREAIMKGQTDFAEGGSVQGYADGGSASNSLAALYEKYHAEPTTRISYADGGSVDSAPVYDPAVIAAIAASITEDNYA